MSEFKRAEALPITRRVINLAKMLTGVFLGTMAVGSIADAVELPRSTVEPQELHLQTEGEATAVEFGQNDNTTLDNSSRYVVSVKFEPFTPTEPNQTTQIMITDLHTNQQRRLTIPHLDRYSPQPLPGAVSLAEVNQVPPPHLRVEQSLISQNGQELFLLYSDFNSAPNEGAVLRYASIINTNTQEVEVTRKLSDYFPAGSLVKRAQLIGNEGLMTLLVSIPENGVYQQRYYFLDMHTSRLIPIAENEYFDATLGSIENSPNGQWWAIPLGGGPSKRIEVRSTDQIGGHAQFIFPLGGDSTGDNRRILHNSGTLLASYESTLDASDEAPETIHLTFAYGTHSSPSYQDHSPQTQLASQKPQPETSAQVTITPRGHVEWMGFSDNRFVILWDSARLPDGSQMVTADFYDPYTGQLETSNHFQNRYPAQPEHSDPEHHDPDQIGRTLLNHFEGQYFVSNDQVFAVIETDLNQGTESDDYRTEHTTQIAPLGTLDPVIREQV
jgi:hypothetical protein